MPTENLVFANDEQIRQILAALEGITYLSTLTPERARTLLPTDKEAQDMKQTHYKVMGLTFEQHFHQDGKTPKDNALKSKGRANCL